MCRPNQSGAEAAGTSDRDGLASLKHTPLSSPAFRGPGSWFCCRISSFFPPSPSQRVVLILFFSLGVLERKHTDSAASHLQSSHLHRSGPEIMHPEKHLPELMAEKNSLDPSFVHAVRLLAEGKSGGEFLICVYWKCTIRSYLPMGLSVGIVFCSCTLAPVRNFSVVMVSNSICKSFLLGTALVT